MARTLEHLILACVLLNAGDAEGQTFLSNAQVFDFQPGDVFQSRFESGTNWGSGSNPPVYWTDTVLTRQDSQGLDTITYVVKHWSFGLPSGPDIPPTISSSWDTLVVTDLADSARQYTAMYFCPPIFDSIGAIGEGCGRATWWQYPAGDTCFFEPNGWISWVIEGCGGPFYSYGQDGYVGSRNLIYFHKGSEECGQFYELPLGAPVVEGPPEILITLDPATWQLTAGGAPFAGAAIVNASGQWMGLLKSSRPLDMAAWSAGVYIVYGTDGHGRAFHRRVAKY